MTRKERNAFICQLYREGSTQEELANRFQRTKVRIGQILAGAGLVKEDRPKMKTERTGFVGVNLRPEVKTALRNHTENMSAWIAETVERELEQQGVNLRPAVIDTLKFPPLPFEKEAS